MDDHLNALHLADKSLAQEAEDLYAAYRLANGLNDIESRKVQEFLDIVRTPVDTASLYNKARDIDRLSHECTAGVVRHLNSFMHLESVVQEIRRGSLLRQLTRRMWKKLRPADGSDPVLPLPYGCFVPGGWAEWLFPHYNRNGEIVQPLAATPDELIAMIGAIFPEKVFTQHPTNSNTVETNRIVAEMVAAGLEVVCPNNDTPAENAARFTAALQKFAVGDRAPPHNFSVSDEIGLSNNATRNFLEGRAASFTELLQLAEARFGKDFTVRHKLELAKAYRVGLGDWSAGDKDGNNNIKAEHRLLKIALQREMMAGYYAEKIAELGEGVVENASFLKLRSRQFARLQIELGQLVSDIRAYTVPGGDIVIPPNKFAELSSRINRVCFATTGCGYQDFIRAFKDDLVAACTQREDTASGPKLLALLNDLHNAGMRGYYIELRENCRFSADVFGELAHYLAVGRNGFAALTANQQLARLDDYIRHPRLLQGAAQRLVKNVESLAIKDRDYDNPSIKAYHALVSLRLVQEHPDCFENIVLAETGSANDILTALALQTAMQSPGKERRLNIVALFEDPDSLENYGSIILKALSFESYRDFMVKMRGQMQIMFAHSDSWRLAGRIAADGLLGIARMGRWGLSQLENMRIASQSGLTHLILCVYNGLSLSDPSRSGGRDPIGNINGRIIARHPKNTVQGGDLANHNNSPATIARGLQKDMTKAAKVLAGRSRPINLELEDIVCRAAEMTQESYRIRHFLGDMPHILAHPFFNYALNAITSNFSSRAASRGKAQANPWLREPPPVSLDGSRAISVSTTFFYANMVNNWYVADVFERNLARKITSDPLIQEKIRNEIARFSGQPATAYPLLTEGGGLSPLTAQTLYRISSEYRRCIDKMVQGVALTDLRLNAVRRAHAEAEGIPDHAMTEAEKKQMYGEYCAAARLGIMSFTGKESPFAGHKPSLQLCAIMKKKIQEDVLPMEDRDYLERLALLPIAIRDRIIASQINKAAPMKDGEAWYPLLRELDNAVNRVRGPHLNNNDVALAFFIRELSGRAKPAPEVPAESPYIRAARQTLAA